MADEDQKASASTDSKEGCWSGCLQLFLICLGLSVLMTTCTYVVNPKAFEETEYDKCIKSAIRENALTKLRERACREMYK